MTAQPETIQVHCHCGRRLRAKLEQAGKTFPCPACGSSLTVPRPSPPQAPDQNDEADETGILRDLFNGGQPEPPNENGEADATVPATPLTQLSPTISHRLPLILSAVALFISLTSFARSFLHDPLGAGIRQYDLSTPEKSLRAITDLRHGNNIRAQIEIGKLSEGKKLQEKSKTLKVHSESNYQGKKILFVSFTENGIPKNDIEAFEKDADTGLWFPKYVSTYSMSDPAIEKAIKDWKAKAPNSESE